MRTYAFTAKAQRAPRISPSRILSRRARIFGLVVRIFSTGEEAVADPDQQTHKQGSEDKAPGDELFFRRKQRLVRDLLQLVGDLRHWSHRGRLDAVKEEPRD